MSLLQKSRQFLNELQQRHNSITTARRAKGPSILQKPVWCDWNYLRFFPSFAEIEKVHILHSNDGKLLYFRVFIIKNSFVSGSDITSARHLNSLTKVAFQS